MWVKQYLALIMRLGVMVVIAIVLGLARPEFLTVSNIINVLRQSSLIFLLAAGLTVVVLSEGIDLSVGQVLALSACIMGWLLKSEPMAIAIFAGLAIGAACGLVNGVLIAAVFLVAA